LASLLFCKFAFHELLYLVSGNMAGALVSGVLYKLYGAIAMFHINSIIAVIGAVVYYISNLLLNRSLALGKIFYG